MIKKIILIFLSFFLTQAIAQDKVKTQIRGFMDIGGKFDFQQKDNMIMNDKLSFVLGEQDLFITSDITSRISFLGESVFLSLLPTTKNAKPKKALHSCIVSF